MEITVSDIDMRIKRVTLVGKLDIIGAEKIGLPLAAAAGSKSNIVVDMSGVDFIASIGIRHLVMAAKVVSRNAARLLLLAPTPMVTEVLVVSGLQDLLPIVRSEEEAMATFSSRGS